MSPYTVIVRNDDGHPVLRVDVEATAPEGALYQACRAFPTGELDETKPSSHEGRSDGTSRAAAILGAADGLTIVVALIFGRSPAVFHAALDAGIGEFVGMAAALYLSSAKSRIFPAFLCGLTTLAACVLPALPFLMTGPHWLAVVIASVISAGLGGLICVLRQETGWLAVTETYGVLALSAGLCFAVSLL